MAGVLGCFAFGVGSTDMANAWYTKDIRIRVPETVRYVLKGRKRADVAANVIDNEGGLFAIALLLGLLFIGMGSLTVLSLPPHHKHKKTHL